MDPLGRYEAQLRGRLDLLAKKNRLRELRGREGLDLSSNDYLGLADHPRIRAAMAHALDEGVLLGSTGSRLLRGNAPEHDALETELAAWKNAEAALIFNSGYDANVGVISTLCGAGDVIFCDALNHASMIDGARISKAEKVIFPHNDLGALSAALAEPREARNRFVLVESLYSMDGDRAPLAEIAALAARHDAMLIVDEAHATGVFGPHGAGLACEAGVVPLIAIHTCGKGWGSFGAFVSTTHTVRDYLINSCRRFIFTTALPPLLPVQWREVMNVIKDEPERAAHVLALGEQLREGLGDIADTGASTSQIVPVICGEDARALAVAEGCREAGFDIRAIRPPTVPRGSARLRIALNASLSTEDIDRLIQHLHHLLRK